MKSSPSAWNPPHGHKYSLSALSPPLSHSVFTICFPHTYLNLVNLAHKTIPLTQDYKITFFIWEVQRIVQNYTFFLKCSRKFTAIPLSYIEIYYQQSHWDFWALNSLYRMRQSIQKIQKYKTDFRNGTKKNPTKIKARNPQISTVMNTM